jgi:hypothetical protein
VQSGRKRIPSVTKIREQHRRNKVEAQVLEADGTIMSVAEEDEATSGYHYPDYNDSEESDSSMPPLMDIAELGSKRKTPTSFYSNFEVGKDDDWEYTIPEPNSGSPPPRSPPSTYQPPSQPTSTYHQPPSDPPTWTHHPAFQPNHHSQPPHQPTHSYQPVHQPTHSYQPPFSYLSQEFPRDFWEPVLPTPRTHHQPTHGREDQRLEQEELEELKRLNQAAGHSFVQLPEEQQDFNTNKFIDNLRKEFQEAVTPKINLRRRPGSIEDFVQVRQNVEKIFTKGINAGAEYLMQWFYREDHKHPEVVRQSTNVAKKVLDSVDPTYLNELVALNKEFAEEYKKSPRTIMKAICEDLVKFNKFAPTLVTEALDGIYMDPNIPNLSLLDVFQRFNVVMAKTTCMGIDRKTLSSEAVRALKEVFRRNTRTMD